MAVIVNPKLISSYIRTLRCLQDASIVNIQPLGGGITNTNYILQDASDKKYVLKLFGKTAPLLGIHRDTEKKAFTAAYSIRLAPKIIYFNPSRGISITEYLEGKTLDKDEVKNIHLSKIITSLKKFHTYPIVLKEFSPYRTIRKYIQLLNTHAGIPLEINDVISTILRVEYENESKSAPLKPCHNDLLGSNLIYSFGNIFFIDWEYAGMGNPLFDLGNLAANNNFEHIDMKRMAEAYYNTCSEEIVTCIVKMKAVSHIREILWAHVQRNFSTIPFDFQAYADVQFDTLLRDYHVYNSIWVH